MLRIEIPWDFGLREEHALVRDEARRFLSERCPMIEVRRVVEEPAGYDPDLWKEIGRLGWLGLEVPEPLGGAGLGSLAGALLLEETGRCLLPSPLLGSLLAEFVIQEAGDPEQQARWLPAVAAGERIASAALTEADGSFEPHAVRSTAEATRNGFRLRGTRIQVVAASEAELLLAPFRVGEKEVAIFAVEAGAPGVEIEAERGVDLTRRTARVRFEDVRVDGTARLARGDAGALRRVLVRAWVALAAETVGAAEATLGLTRDYAVERKQFGRPIGSFQAVKHPLVDVMVGVEQARTLAYAAAAAIDAGAPGAEIAARMAKAKASDVLSLAVRKGVQLHGGYGFTWDCDVHFYFRRSLWSRAALGEAREHRRFLGAHLCENEESE